MTGLRFFTVYGPWGRPDMAAYLFTTAIFEGRPIQLFNSGNMQRDFTYIDDIVAGVLAALDRQPPKDENGRRHRIYNLGNNHPEDAAALPRADRGVLRPQGDHRECADAAGRRGEDLRRHHRIAPRSRIRAEDADRRGRAEVRRLVPHVSREMSAGCA